ncbi:MAG: hypothetical protein AABY18_10140 [Candidatus Thermoplasmatota archaeon]
MRAASALAVLAMVPLLAGCTGGDDAPGVVAGIPAADLEAGHFYAFRHNGGALVFTLDGDGDAAFDLYDGNDRRLGSVGFSSETTRSGLHRIDGVGAGELVLGLLTLNGTLRVESGGSGVASFQALADHIERHVLVDRAPRADLMGPIGIGGLPLSDQQSADEAVAVALRRAPAQLRVLGTGPWSNLTVDVLSEKGVVLSTGEAAATPVFSIEASRELVAIAGQFTPQNLRDGNLTARVRADDLAGALLLEARSYSRAGLPGPAQAGPDVADVAFTYGVLPDAPVSFDVHGDATRLVLWQEGPPADNATVAVFGPDDRKLAVVHVPRTGTIVVPVAAAGQHVAILLGGKATLGADEAPSDFDLRPLDVTDTVVPSGRAGENGRYAIANEQLDLPTAFRFLPTVVSTPGDVLGQPQMPFGSCTTGLFARVDQAGEAVLAAVLATPGSAADPAPFVLGTMALRDGPLTLTYDGLGDDGCDRPAIVIQSYVRP